MSDAAFKRTLSLTLPDEQETDVLRACLLEGERARRSWERWQAAVTDPSEALRPRLRGLGPLLHEALRRHGVEVRDRRFLTVLRTSSVREELRSATVRRSVAEVLGDLRRRGADPVVLKGVALAESVYPQPALRHVHDLDLLAPSQRSWSHGSGLAVHQHASVFLSVRHHGAEQGMRARVEPATVAGVPALVLSPADTLVHVCAHAFALAGRNVAQWVPDAWLLLRARQVDWDVVRATAREGRLGIPLSVMLGYLAERMEAPVPQPVLEELRRAAGSASGGEREAALGRAWLAGRARGRIGLREARVLGPWAAVRAARSVVRGRTPRPLVGDP